MTQKGWFTSVAQKDLDERYVIPGTTGVIPEGIIEESRGLLERALKELLE